MSVPPGTPTTGVRVLLTARSAGYLTLSEVEVYAKAPGVGGDATAAGIAVDGVPVPEFDPQTSSYQVRAARHGRCAVTATATDPYATVAVTSHPAGRRATVVVTSEDGAQTRTYQVTCLRR